MAAVILNLVRALSLLLTVFLTACGTAESTHQPATMDITLGGERFTLELALTEEQRFQGLSDRPHIPPNGGMLFVFPNSARRAFVMRQCLVPIDIAFLAHNGMVVSVHEMAVEPYDTPEERLKRYDSGWPAMFAIEVAGGTLRRLGIRPGHKVDLPYESLRARAR